MWLDCKLSACIQVWQLQAPAFLWVSSVWWAAVRWFGKVVIWFKEFVWSWELMSTGFLVICASPGFLVWLLHSCFQQKVKQEEREREGRRPGSPLFLPSVTHTLPLSPPAPRHLFRSGNFHLKHVELILPLHRFSLFPPLFLGGGGGALKYSTNW